MQLDIVNAAYVIGSVKTTKDEISWCKGNVNTTKVFTPEEAVTGPRAKRGIPLLAHKNRPTEHGSACACADVRA